MAPKRAATTTHSVSVHTGSSVKMMKIGMDHSLEDFGEVIEEKYRIPDDGYSPIEGEPITFEEEDDQSPETRTDTITLLMKIDQLQAELKYERRCRQMAERELKQMKEMNDLMTQMRHTAHDLRTVLDHARGQQGNDVNDVVNDVVTPESCEGQSISYADMPVQMSQEVEDANYIHLPGGLRVQRNLYKGISEIMDFKKYISAMLMVLFDRETLGTHSLQGRRCNIAKEETQKPQLPPDIMRGLLDHVRIKFGVDYSAIRAAVRTKLNNEDKLLKKRLGIR